MRPAVLIVFSVMMGIMLARAETTASQMLLYMITIVSLMEGSYVVASVMIGYRN